MSVAAMEQEVTMCSRCHLLQQSSTRGSDGHLRPLWQWSLLTNRFIVTVLVTLVLFLDKALSMDPLANTPTFKPTDFKEFSDAANSKYYRYMQIDKSNQYLYVGAMEYLYRLKLNDISQVLNSVNLPANPSDTSSCQAQPDKTQNFDCKNHIRAVSITSNDIIVCGTGAFKPRDDILNINDLSIKQVGASSSGRAKCPYDPNDNATSIYIESGNPGGVAGVYAGTVANTKSNPVIYRPRLVQSNGQQASSHLSSYATSDGKWLNGPNFVGSFDVGDYVYFFFRETALEYTNCGKAVFSRVARVCKNDRGGNSVLDAQWSTYLKARLNCSVSGDFPFYFNQIYDVNRIGSTFYTVLTTNNVDGLFGSAVCAFTEADIDKAFSGTFKEQLDSSSLWLPVPQDRIPVQRPGQCLNASTRLLDSVEQFIKDRPLMDEAVSHSNEQAGRPLYYVSGVIMNSVAVDTVTYGGMTFQIFFLGTAYGHIYKVAQWKEGGHARERLLAIWKPFGDKVTTIWQMELYNKKLYVGTDDGVTQLAVEQCSSYSVCEKCAYDPHCGWHRWDKMCTLRSAEAENNVRGDSLTSVCNSNTCLKQSVPYSVNVRVPGDPIYLHCDTHCPTDSVIWYQQFSPIVIDNTKYFLSQNHGLMIFNVTASDQDLYTCKPSTTTSVELAKHNVVLSKCGDNVTCLWQEEFRNWCSEFDAYKKQFNNWVCLKDNCLQDGGCMPSRVTGSCPLPP